MMDLKLFEDRYQELIDKIPDFEIAPSLAKELSTRFFKATYEINKIIKDIRNEMILLEQVCKVVYKQSIERAEGKNVTEKKISADADFDYLESLKKFEEHSNNLEYFRTLYRVMENGHIFYKGISLDR